ncbi:MULTISPECIES: imidazolonepropionase-like domain-containing protein [unclassified Streptomyces]|uniref:amidohydrolase family protein n=1 Tax=unclassified Streptomyces TaxID=2593676 RepID=UPI0037FBF4EF
MSTIHAADLVLPGDFTEIPGGAVLIDGDRIAMIGPYEDMAAEHPAARVRRWPGVLTPGLVNRHGTALLEHTYFPDDPFEADELGTEPITGDALAALAPTASRRGNSARRCTQKLLARGVVAVTGPLTTPAVRTAVQRAGLEVLPGGAGAGPATLDPFAEGAPSDTFRAPLAVGGPARLAVFDVPDEAGLAAHGALTCVATVIGGRLLHRRR